MHSPRTVTTLIVSLAVAGALLLTGCGSETTTSAPTVATSAPTVATSAPAKSGVVSWSCFDDGEEVTCTCEGSEANCRLAVAEPGPVKGATGQVRWFNNDMGYGFITADNGRNVFVLLSAVLDSGLKGLEDGQRIQFQLQENGYKVMAVNIKLL